MTTTGYRIKGEVLSVERLPGRKQTSLNRTTGHGFYPMAYFKSEEDAEWTLSFLDMLARSRLTSLDAVSLVRPKEVK